MNRHQMTDDRNVSRSPLVNPFHKWELMRFEPIVVLWAVRGVRVAWHSYVVLPQDGTAL